LKPKSKSKIRILTKEKEIDTFTTTAVKVVIIIIDSITIRTAPSPYGSLAPLHHRCHHLLLLLLTGFGCARQ
jgi:hypothetical protein